MTNLTADADVVVTRKYALVPLKSALEREGRKQSWLRNQLHDRMGIELGQTRLSNYLNGYARVPQAVLSAMCWILSTKQHPIAETDVLDRVPDEALLIQPARRGKPRK